MNKTKPYPIAKKINYLLVTKSKKDFNRKLNILLEKHLEIEYPPNIFSHNEDIIYSVLMNYYSHLEKHTIEINNFLETF